MGGYTARTQSNSTLTVLVSPNSEESTGQHTASAMFGPPSRASKAETLSTEKRTVQKHMYDTVHKRCSLFTNPCCVRRQCPAHSLKTLSQNLFSIVRAQLLPVSQVCHKANQSGSSDKPIREQEKVNSHWLSLLLSTRRRQKVGFYESSINMGFPVADVDV